MLRSVSGMRGLTMQATDGALGVVDEFLFDEAQWAIRYLVVNTGGWLPGRLVLVSPIACRAVEGDRQTFDVALTRQQVEQSPRLAPDQPVTRQLEEEYARYYGYPYYWDGLGLWGASIYPRLAPRGAVHAPAEGPATAPPPSDTSHLRSTRAVTGYTIQARDGALGQVDDFIVDDESWALRYMVVETRHWWPGKQVLVPPQWIESVQWAQASIVVDLLRETIKASAKYDPATLRTSGGRDQTPPASPVRVVRG